MNDDKLDTKIESLEEFTEQTIVRVSRANGAHKMNDDKLDTKIEDLDLQWLEPLRMTDDKPGMRIESLVAVAMLAGTSFAFAILWPILQYAFYSQ